MENENKKLGSEPAFPTQPETIVVEQQSYTYTDEKGNTQIGYNNVYGSKQNQGMSKRFYAACDAKDDFDEYCRPLQEAIVGRQAPNLTTEPLLHMEWVAEGIAKWKYMKADALLKQENE